MAFSGFVIGFLVVSAAWEGEKIWIGLGVRNKKVAMSPTDENHMGISERKPTWDESKGNLLVLNYST